MFKQLQITFLTIVGLTVLQCHFASSQSKVVSAAMATSRNSYYNVLIRLNGIYHCGGSILTRDTILTAASCVPPPSDPFSYTVIVGEMNKGVFEGTEQAFVPEKIDVHPDFKPATYDADIAVIHLRESMNFNDFVNDIRIAEYGTKWYIGTTKGIVIGWGDGSADNLMYSITSNIPDQNTCNNEYMRVATFCATSGACSNDRGSAFVVPSSSGQYIQVGIASQIYKCENVADVASGIFTDVSAYTQWILDVADNVETGSGHIMKFSIMLMTISSAIAIFLNLY